MNFKLKEDSQYRTENRRIENVKEKIDDAESILLATMINMYYEPSVQTKLFNIKIHVNLLLSYIERQQVIDLVQSFKEENWERYLHYSTDDIESNIEYYEDAKRHIYRELLMLATVRFVKNEDSRFGANQEMEYLRSSYIEDVYECLRDLKEETEDYATAKFLKEECEVTGDPDE